MVRGVGCQICLCKQEQPAGGGKSFSMLGMKGVGVLKLQMNECPGQLDQPLVKSVIGSIPSILEPEMLQHIMRFVIPLRVEALEVSEVAGIKQSPVPGMFRILGAGESEGFHEELDAVGLIHRPVISLTRESDTSKQVSAAGRCPIHLKL